MTIEPLLSAEASIQIHAFSAVAATLIGAFILWRTKGNALHKALGRLWVVLMLIAATSALFIQEIRLVGPFSPIHLFSVFTYVCIAQGMHSIIVRRDIRRHRAHMQALYAGALILAGAFTFLPGRRMHAVLFGQDEGWPASLAVIVPMLVVAVLVIGNIRSRGVRRTAARPAPPVVLLPKSNKGPLN